ncbi:MAG: type III-B CRISPR module-associated protein Cmr5 [Marinobacterium sp.]|nr:type III-B CRISPR module-associated protein Cmr5 [Marinobacterium sp.]
MSQQVADERQSIEQQRAQHALAWLKLQKADSAIENRELKSYLRRMPVMIQTNGFGQTLAFYYSKKSSSSAYGAIYQLLEQWLCDKCPRAIYNGRDYEAPVLLTALTAGSQASYMQASAEARTLLVWAKKFADALLGETEDDNDTGDR